MVLVVDIKCISVVVSLVEKLSVSIGVYGKVKERLLNDHT